MTRYRGFTLLLTIVSVVAGLACLVAGLYLRALPSHDHPGANLAPAAHFGHPAYAANLAFLTAGLILFLGALGLWAGRRTMGYPLRRRRRTISPAGDGEFFHLQSWREDPDVPDRSLPEEITLDEDDLVLLCDTLGEKTTPPTGWPALPGWAQPTPDLFDDPRERSEAILQTIQEISPPCGSPPPPARTPSRPLSWFGRLLDLARRPHSRRDRSD